MKLIEAIIIGAGDRGGHVYGQYALKFPEEIKIVGIAEPNEERRSMVVKQHKIEDSHIFKDWQDVFNKSKFADAVIVTTQDSMHYEPAIKAMELGYNVLLEKPMATTAEECKKLVERAEEKGVLLQICHVMRYADFGRILKNLISSGKIGKLVNISWRENVAMFHYAHSYIRGNWRNREKASPMILAKSCHDLDMLYWLVGEKVARVNSFGSQLYFGKKNKPQGTPEYCLEGCPIEKECVFYAPRIYIDIIPLLHVVAKGGKFIEKIIAKIILRYPWIKKIPPFRRASKYSGWPINTVTLDPSLEGRKKALLETNYGKCVYSVNDHNTVDHQTVNIEFVNGVTATFTMHGFAIDAGRTLRIEGTKGTIIGEFLDSKEEIVLVDALSEKEVIIRKTGMTGMHGGGDDLLMKSFIKLLRGDSKQDDVSDARAALESHLMAFAADKARLEKRVVEMDEIR